MAALARRLAPAAALGGLAVVIVGVADPALAGLDQSSVPTPVPASASAPAVVESPPSAATEVVSSDVAGPVIQTRWGPVQVAGTVVGGQLTEVHALVWPDGDRRSAEISQIAIPELDSRANSQGIEFDAVSGASYTSEGYRASLQQLLDSL